MHFMTAHLPFFSPLYELFLLWNMSFPPITFFLLHWNCSVEVSGYYFTWFHMKYSSSLTYLTGSMVFFFALKPQTLLTEGTRYKMPLSYVWYRDHFRNGPLLLRVPENQNILIHIQIKGLLNLDPNLEFDIYVRGSLAVYWEDGHRVFGRIILSFVVVSIGITTSCSRCLAQQHIKFFWQGILARTSQCLLWFDFFYYFWPPFCCVKWCRVGLLNRLSFCAFWYLRDTNFDILEDPHEFWWNVQEFIRSFLLLLPTPCAAS